MIRRSVLILLCGALVMGAPVAGAAAQERERPAQELWDEFPLEPAPDEAQATDTPTATPTPTPTQAPAAAAPSDGMSTAALIALVVIAGAIGGLTARLAMRRLRPAPATTAAAAPLPEPFAPGPAAAPWSTSPPEPPAERAPPPRARRLPVRPLPRPAADPEPPSPPRPLPRPAASPEPPPSPPSPLRQPAADPEPLPEPWSQPLEPPARPRPERRAEPPARPRRAEPPARPRPEPAPQPVAKRPPAARTRRFAPTRGTWEACSIKLQKRADQGRFCAMAEQPQRVIAYSPLFPLDPGDQAPAALKVLVAELHDAGWHQTAVGARPWQLDFERPADAPQPADP